MSMFRSPFYFIPGSHSDADIVEIVDDEIDAQKGIPNGIAELDSGGRLPASQLTLDAMEYLGAWNVSTNTPTLIDGTGNTGDFYRVSVGGTRNLGSGAQTWAVGDSVIYNGTIWQKIPAADLVTSVAGRTGDVVIVSTDLADFTEAAQDATGAMRANSARVTLTYVDATPSLTADLVLDSITAGYMHAAAGLSVFGRAANTSGAGGEITAANDGEVMRRSGTSIAFGTLLSSSFADNTIALARLVNATAQYTLLGRTSSGAGAWQEKATSADVFTMLGSANNAAIKTNIGAASLTGGNVLSGDQAISLATSTGFNLTYVGTGLVGPFVDLYYNSPTPTNADYPGYFRFYSNNLSGTKKLTAQFGVQMLDSTAGSEDATFQMTVISAGGLVTPLSCGPGIQVGAPTGGDKGLGALNAVQLYEANVRVATKAANTFTATQTFSGAATQAWTVTGSATLSAYGDFVNTGGRMIFGVDDASGAGFFTGGLAYASVAISQANTAFVFGTNSLPRMFIAAAGGMYMAATTGASQGNGTINAAAVYDDGVLIVCMPHNPEMSQDDWNALTVHAEREVERVETIVEPETLLDKVLWYTTFKTFGGKRVKTVVMESVTGGKNVTAKRHFRMLEEGFDPADPENYFARLDDDKALPGLLTQDEWKARMIDNGVVDKVSHAEINERTILAMDYLAITTRAVHEKNKALEARLAALEAK